VGLWLAQAFGEIARGWPNPSHVAATVQDGTSRRSARFVAQPMAASGAHTLWFVVNAVSDVEPPVDARTVVMYVGEREPLQHHHAMRVFINMFSLQCGVVAA
jgi:hypothetical protein